jgi:pimeloyl-ACP methyl ester carboxylesterase
VKIIESDFMSKGVRCDGELYLTPDVDCPPVVIMAHGMAALKSFRLPAYAERFVERKMAVFLFDYRTFGKSDGEPRHIVNPFHHIQDWRAAIAHVRTLKEIDRERIALWGSSFSGAHVIACAARDQHIAAVVSQVPYVSGITSMQSKDFLDIIMSAAFTTWDIIRAALSFTPCYSPVIAPPGSFAAMNSEESYRGYMSIVPGNLSWENKLASRMFFYIPFYSVMNCARKVNAPTLVMAGRYDSLVPLKAVIKMAGNLPKGGLIVEDCNHFEPYTGKFFERFVHQQCGFLEKHLIRAK